jgi:hypothetical protein
MEARERNPRRLVVAVSLPNKDPPPQAEVLLCGI